MNRAVILGVSLLCGFFALGGAGAAETFSYDAYARVLSSRVNERGLVDYRRLKQEPRDLRMFVEALGRLDPGVYRRWPEAERIAFWINAYNALTLEVVVGHYPKRSIRQIPGVWDKLEREVMGQRMTLDHIEHGILRKEFKEPRIHMALVCAAMGCPPLRREPYTGDRLEAQLEDQTARFLADPTKLRLDRDSRRVELSSIFKWFGEDFLKAYGTGERFSGRPDRERAVLGFVAKHLPPEARRELETGGGSVSYLDYDWSLNEQPWISTIAPLMERP